MEHSRTIEHVIARGAAFFYIYTARLPGATASILLSPRVFPLARFLRADLILLFWAPSAAYNKM